MSTLGDLYKNPIQAVSIRTAEIQRRAAQIETLSVGLKTAFWLTQLARAARLAADLLTDTQGGPVGQPEAGALVLIEKLAQGSWHAYATLAALTDYPLKPTYMTLATCIRALYQHIHNSRGQSYFMPQAQTRPISEWFSDLPMPIRVTRASYTQAEYLAAEWRILPALGIAGIEQALAITASGVVIDG